MLCFFRSSVFLLGLSCLTGCGSEVAPNVFPVHGRLIVGHVPASGASIIFHPLDHVGSTEIVPTPVGRANQDGSFQLTTFSLGDGAPPGDYVVTVFWPDPAKPIDDCECKDMARHDFLAGRYSDPANSSLMATIEPHENEVTLWIPTEIIGSTPQISSRKDPADR